MLKFSLKKNEWSNIFSPANNYSGFKDSFKKQLLYSYIIIYVLFLKAFNSIAFNLRSENRNRPKTPQDDDDDDEEFCPISVEEVEIKSSHSTESGDSSDRSVAVTIESSERLKD